MKAALLGCGYGAVLAALAFLATGAGHGTYVPMGISSAPCGLLGFWAACIGAPALWAIVALLLAIRRRTIVILVMIAHYGGAVLLASRGPFSDWDDLWRNIAPLGVLLGVWVGVYVLGQAAIWRSLFRDEGGRIRLS